MSVFAAYKKKSHPQETVNATVKQKVMKGNLSEPPHFSEQVYYMNVLLNDPKGHLLKASSTVTEVHLHY